MNHLHAARQVTSFLRVSKRSGLLHNSIQRLLRRQNAQVPPAFPSWNGGSRSFSACTGVKDATAAESAPKEFANPYLPNGIIEEQVPVIKPSNVPQGLPQSCPGCGALTQQETKNQPGYYSTTRKAVKQYLRRQNKERSGGRVPNEPADVEVLAERSGTALYTPSAALSKDATSPSTTGADTPYCDRCHTLIHDNQGQSIIHPTIDDIADSIAESPFKRNHVYLVLDAADFPMSLVPGFFSKLELARPRSQNRRSQHDFSSKPTMSFIITRSDLLGSTKEMVDSMMFYFQNTLREALGRRAKDLRLGNVHLVSAKRGWWTKEIKEEIWKRGGGNWMVGKVNVGKSNLFEVLFPKGARERAPVYAELHQQQSQTDRHVPEEPIQNQDGLLDEKSLLPPPQPESPFPVMPVVSSLPGTTASPIRLPFGQNRGELIDLPGLARGDLENYVKPEHRRELIMEHRENVEQVNIRPGQCLEIGDGLVTIVPDFDASDPSMTYLAYCFVPLDVHVTSVAKAKALRQNGKQHAKSILKDNMVERMKPAGNFDLDTDVTKRKSGPLIAAGLSVSALPFRVYATDILLEGLGWIELVAQVRRPKHLPSVPSPATAPAPAASLTVAEDEAAQGTFKTFDSAPSEAHRQEDTPSHIESSRTFFDGFFLPRVQITSPEGKHIAQRQCLQAWSRWTSSRKDGKAVKVGTKNKSARRVRRV